MNNKNNAASSFHLSDANGDVFVDGGPNPEMFVTVIATTTDGTTSALNAARCLARDLDAQITLLKLEEVPFRYALEKPPVSPEFVANQMRSVVLSSGATGKEVVVRTCLCREKTLCLRGLLRRRALVVVGGKKGHWWSTREEKLEQALLEMGHHVIFIEAGHKLNGTPGNDLMPYAGAGEKSLREDWRTTQSFSVRERSQQNEMEGR